MSKVKKENINKDTKDMNNEEYLEKKVRCLIEPLITSLLKEKPSEPVRTIILLFQILYHLK